MLMFVPDEAVDVVKESLVQKKNRLLGLIMQSKEEINQYLDAKNEAEVKLEICRKKLLIRKEELRLVNNVLGRMEW